MTRKPRRRAGGKEVQKAWPRVRAESSLRGQVLESRRKVLSGDPQKQKGLCGNLANYAALVLRTSRWKRKLGPTAVMCPMQKSLPWRTFLNIKAPSCQLTVYYTSVSIYCLSP